MNLRLLTVASHLEYEGLDNLLRSAEMFDWEIDVIYAEWNGFGTKLIETYNHLKKNPDIDHFVFVDAYDVLLLWTPEEFEKKLIDKDKMLISVEKMCWPDPSLATQYPEAPYEWKYINSGSYYSPSKLFTELFEANVPDSSTDDQLWLTKAYLDSSDNKVLDYYCNLFQSYSFISDDDFGYEENRVQNLKTKTQPIVIHGNGKTNMDKVLNLLDL